MGQGLSRRSEKANDCLYCGFPGESGSRTLQNHPHMAFSLSPRAALPRHSKAELCQNLLRGVRAVLRLIFPAGNSPLRCSARAPSFFVVWGKKREKRRGEKKKEESFWEKKREQVFSFRKKKKKKIKKIKKK